MAGTYQAFAAGQGAASVADPAPAHTSDWLANLADRDLSTASRARKLNALHTFAR